MLVNCIPFSWSGIHDSDSHSAHTNFSTISDLDSPLEASTRSSRRSDVSLSIAIGILDLAVLFFRSDGNNKRSGNSPFSFIY